MILIVLLLSQAKEKNSGVSVFRVISNKLSSFNILCQFLFNLSIFKTTRVILIQN